MTNAAGPESIDTMLVALCGTLDELAALRTLLDRHFAGERLAHEACDRVSIAVAHVRTAMDAVFLAKTQMQPRPSHDAPIEAPSPP